MNANRRKQIGKCFKRLEEIEGMIGEVLEMIADVKDEEEEAYDNLPESLQESGRGQAMYDAIDALDSAYEALEDFDISSVTDFLGDAQA